jgi:hypothetical protein
VVGGLLRKMGWRMGRLGRVREIEMMVRRKR